MKLEKVQILSTSPNLNGRMYPLHVLESIRDQINSNEPHRNIGTMGYSEGLDVNLTDAAFTYANARIIDEALYVDIESLKTPKGDTFKHSIEVDSRCDNTHIVFRTAGRGTLKDGDGVQVVNDDFRLISVAAINKDEDAFKQ